MVIDNDWNILGDKYLGMPARTAGSFLRKTLLYQRVDDYYFKSQFLIIVNSFMKYVLVL